jgi:hypothetical protein
MSARWTKEEAAALMAKQVKRIEKNQVRLTAKAKDCMKPATKPTAKYEALIGIDPGTNTGIAVKQAGYFKSIQTKTIIEAIEMVKRINQAHAGNILVKIEDARLRTFFGKSGSEKWKGAGSIMRDCSIWEDEMNRCKINVEFVHPRHVKATTQDFFEKLTGWKDRTSIHAREAAYLILND